MQSMKERYRSNREVLRNRIYLGIGGIFYDPSDPKNSPEKVPIIILVPGKRDLVGILDDSKQLEFIIGGSNLYEKQKY